MMLRILVFGMFGVTIVSMQRSVVRHIMPSATFTSGQYPDTGAVDHAWEITVHQNHQIFLQFLDFSLNEATSCSIDVLELYDGGQSDNVLIARFCWNNATALASAAYVSTGNQLYLRLITAEGYSRKGFRAHYISVDLQHTDSSGEITSPGYPNTGEPLDEAWRIQVNEGHQIRLEFLDFALYMSLPCVNDYFEIYDGSSNRYCMLERWCWKTFTELPQTVYISTGNTLYLRLRTMHGFSRKGFNASYFSAPRHTNLTGGNEHLSCFPSMATTPEVSTQTFLNNGISVTATSHRDNGSTTSTILPINGVNHSMSTAATDTSINTKPTSASTLPTTQPMTDLIIYIIPIALAVLLISCFFIGLCCWCYHRKLKKPLDAEASATLKMQESRTSKPPENEQESGIVHLKEEAKSKSDDKTIIASPEDNQLMAIYALPNKGNRQVNKSDDEKSTSRGHSKAEQSVEAISLIQQSDGSLQSTDVTDLLGDTHPDENKNETKVKDASPSDGKETMVAFNQRQTQQDYAYVDHSSAKGLDISNNAVYSFPDKKTSESLEMVPNEAYESFDGGPKEETNKGNEVDDIPYSVPFDKTREGSIVNEAYQSYDSDEDEGIKGGDKTYYYVDKNDKEKIEDPTELFYESV